MRLLAAFLGGIILALAHGNPVGTRSANYLFAGDRNCTDACLANCFVHKDANETSWFACSDLKKDTHYRKLLISFSLIAVTVLLSMVASWACFKACCDKEVPKFKKPEIVPMISLPIAHEEDELMEMQDEYDSVHDSETYFEEESEGRLESLGPDSFS